MTHDTYLGSVFTIARRKKQVSAVAKIIRAELKKNNIAHKDITLVGTGISGTMSVAILGFKLDMATAIVRKGEPNHSINQIEATEEIKQYYIVDDFISGGTTVKRIVEQVKKFYPTAQCLGFFGFADMTDSKWRAKRDQKSVEEVCPMVRYTERQTST